MDRTCCLPAAGSERQTAVLLPQEKADSVTNKHRDQSKTPLPLHASAPSSTWYTRRQNLTVRLLEPGAGTGTAELLGLATAVVGNKKCTVVLCQGLLEQVLAVLIDELLVVGHDRLGDSLADCVDLRSVTTSGDADTDVHVGNLVKADDQKRLVNLVSKSGGLDEVERAAVDLDEALALDALGDGGGRLLLAEALDSLLV